MSYTGRMIETEPTTRRKIIQIDEAKCDGCGQCLPNCPEGALQLIEGKARLVSDLCCDGLGACLGHCPQGAITIEEREAAAYDERCAMSFAPPSSGPQTNGSPPASELRHWPIQLHLINPQAPHFQGTDLLLSADCVPFALGRFHQDFLRGKTLAIACPKLDEGQEVYWQKLTALADFARINTITVMIMQVPCCSGLLRLVQAAVAQARRPVPVKCMVVSLQGDILREEWVLQTPSRRKSDKKPC